MFTPVSSVDATSGPDLSVAASMSANSYAYAHTGSIRNPSLAPNVGHASLGDTASGMLPPTVLGRYTEPDNLLAQAQDRFWICTSERDRGVDSGSDLSYAEFDSRSAFDRYFAEVGTRRDSATVSAVTQVGLDTWTPMVPDPSQLGPYLLSDIGTRPTQFKKPKTPPPRTVVATTHTEMYLRHTSQDMVDTSPPGYRRSSSSSTSTGSRITCPPQTPPRSSVQQWLDALDTQGPPPRTPVIPVSQPVSMYSGVTSSIPLGYSASQMAPQQV